MKRKLLSVLLTLAMALTLLPVSAMAEGETGTLQSQIATSGTVTLDKDYTEDITIPSGADVTLDLNGKTLSNTNNGKATLSVEGTAVVKNGTIIGGTGYYNIEVKKGGSLTLENVTATAGNTGSSMIDNWGTLTITSGTYSGGLNVVKSEEGSTLNISGGKFELSYATNGYTGVIFAYGTTTITGGEFIQSLTSTGRWNHPQVVATGVVEGYPAITKITGGTFTNNISGEGIFRGVGKGTSDNFEVSGGTFNKSVSDGFFKDGYFAMKNAGGTYDAAGPFAARVNSTAGYSTLAEAIAAAKAGDTVTLLTDVEVSEPITVDTAITLDLGGYTLTNSYDGGGYSLLTRTAVTMKNGTYKSTNDSVRGIGAVADFTLENAKLSAVGLVGLGCSAPDATYTVKNSTIIGNYALANFVNNAAINIKNSTITGSGVGIYHNGSNSGLKLTATDSTITAAATGATNGVYISGSTSTMTAAGAQQVSLTNCTVSGGTAVEVKYTDLTLTDCTVTATAETPSYTQDDNGAATTGFAVVSTDNTTGAAMPEPKGKITIQGANGSYTGLVGLGALKSVKDSYTGFKDETIKVSGGTFSSAVLPEYCADGFVPKDNGNGTFGVKVDPSVAEVNGVKYDTLQAAIDKAPRNATVTLLADTRENVTIDKAMTLDLNGHTLNGSTGERKPALTITARTVTIKDSSEAQTGTIMREDTAENSGVSSHYVIDIQGNAWVMFESGKVMNNSGNTAGKGASLVRVGDDSVDKYPGLNIKGGTFTQDNFIVIKVDRGDLFLNGGTLNCANSYAIEDWHRATIKGGTVNGTVAAWTYIDGSNSTLTISGGTVNGNVEAVSFDGTEGKLAKVAITGGTVNGTLSTKRYGEEAAPSKDKATIEVTGGTFRNDPTKYVVEDSAVTKNGDGTYGVAKAYLAQVGENSYYTMDEAFKAQTASGEEIVLLRNYTTGSTFNSGTVARVVDLNGHTWTCTGTDANSAAFEINYADASLTVKNGKIVSSQLVGLIPSAMGGTIKYDNSGLVFEGVEMSTTATSGIETNGNNTNDTVTLKNSKLNVPNGFGIYFPSSGTLTIDNSTITAKTMGVQVCAGSLNINDGSKITVTGDAVPKAENDGAIQDGAAISIVNRPGYKGLVNIGVTGGTFKANGNNAAIKAYDWNNATKMEETFTESTKVSVSGGTFSSAVKAEYCAPGFVPKANSDGTYGVTRPSSGSSGSYDPTYSVSTPSKTEHGTVTVSPKSASKGDTVTVTVKPDSGYVLETLTVTDKNGNELTLKDKGNGKYTFTMPAGKVEVKATFMEDNSVLNFFYDVPNDAYFYEAVKWAVKNGITTGVGNNLFAPEQPCTRAQIVTFLWRAAGSPEPKGAASGMTDVVSGSYYEKAVAWAIENGITTGTTTTTFSPDATCTRAQAVTFLARALNAKAASAAEFSDVPTDSYFADAVAWAAANGVTEGIGGGLFGSDNDCTRGQIVTFLYRAYNK